MKKSGEVVVVCCLVWFSLACKFPDGSHSVRQHKMAKLSNDPIPHEASRDWTLPVDWDWRNIDGIDYTTPVRNQHLPHYCGSCVAFSVTSTLQDRLQAFAYWQKLPVWPYVVLSPQFIIDCRLGGDCNGGAFMFMFFELMHVGIMEESCNAYKAVNEQCINECMTYWERNTTLTFISNYTRWFVRDASSVSGIDNIKAEIFHRGPVACSMDATNKFIYNYTSGIYSEFIPSDKLELNHAVSIVGWNSQPTPHWIVRNSWGTQWGEDGYFRVPIGQPDFNLGLEKDCYWAVMDTTPLNTIKKWLDPPASFSFPPTPTPKPSPTSTQ